MSAFPIEHKHTCMCAHTNTYSALPTPIIPGNHRGILGAVGFTDIREYRYWNAEGRNLDFDSMLEDFKVSGSS